jgi:hypothetical protein
MHAAMSEMNTVEGHQRVPEARYAYYRRCQLFRRNGEQCKAPAEKGAQICHAHAGQQATAFRRDLERRIVLAEAVAEMRRRGKPECEMADLFTDFRGIQITLAVVSRALIAGRIDCKTAGRLLVGLQMASKLLWMLHRTKSKNLPRINTDDTDLKRAAEAANLTTEARRRGEQQGTPQICTDECRLNREQELPVLPTSQASPISVIGCGIHDEEPGAAVDRKIREFPEEFRSLQNGKWEQTRAA